MQPDNNQPQQPTEPPQESTQPQPAPQPQPQAQEPPQPMPAQPMAPQPMQQQYVVQQKNLNGIGGWLAFWLVIFSLSAVGLIAGFFSILAGEADPSIVNVLFFPILAALALASVVLISAKKKLGMWMSISYFATWGIYAAIAAFAEKSDDAVFIIISGVLVSWVFAGLFILYFLQSERVKQTLVK